MPYGTALELTNAATGFDYTADDFLRCGQRGWTLKRAINNRLGLTAANDTLPKALLTPLPGGGAAGVVPDLPALLADYYAAQGWDAASGRPTRATLLSLGLADVAADLWETET